MTPKTFLTLVFVFSISCYNLWGAPGSGNTISQLIYASEYSTISLNDAQLYIPAGTLEQDEILSLTELPFNKVEKLNPEIINLIPRGNAYRFGPSGKIFSKPLQLELPYDPFLAEGKENEISVFYFQAEHQRWTQIHPDTVMTCEYKVRITITHFTDFITGIIQVPESPETKGYQPTEIKDIKAADASAGITLIGPPEASGMGGAGLQYPIKLPGGTNGLQPELVLSYNNQGGHSPFGLGWSMNLPSIGIETRWGVPRYSTFRETESYTYKGEALWPVAHRASFRMRTGEYKQFFPRVQSAHHKIIRHGTLPANYWWEVIEKSGVRHYFGGKPGVGVLEMGVTTDAVGNIGNWFLLETRDPNGNFISYTYRKGSYPSVNSSNKLYIDEITYTGHGSVAGNYKVLFDTDQEITPNAPLRVDIDVNCSLGFASWCAEVFEKITIQYKDQNVRSYSLTYEEGAFAKTLLKEVSEEDASGNVFYEHKFDYYDEVSTASGYSPFLVEVDADAPDDDLDGGIFADAIYSDELSALSSSSSSNISYGGSFTIGAPGSPIAKNNTVGGNYSRTKGKGNGLLTLTDVNGDRLPDKVMRMGGKLYYRPNLGYVDGNNLLFGERVMISDIDHFSQFKSKGHTKGFEANVRPFSIQKGNNKSVSITDIYYTDFNSDGVIDVARRGTVYFGYIDDDGRLRYSEDSELSASPILAGADIDAQMLADNDGDELTLEDEFPLHDLVQSWTAPKDGRVCIHAPVTYLSEDSEEYDEYSNRDGVIARIEHAGEGVAVSDTIREFTGEDTYDFGFIDFQVDKGDRIYFRLQSIYDGSFDRVHWNPEIQYVEDDCTAELSPFLDANNRDINRYKAKEDFHLFAPQSVVMPINGEISFEHVFDKSMYTSDNIRLEILRTDTFMVTDTILWSTVAWNEILDTINSTTLPVIAGDEITFKISCNTNIDWLGIVWKPTITYLSSPHYDVTDDDGNPLYVIKPAVEADLFGTILRLMNPYTMPDTGTITLRDQISPITGLEIPYITEEPEVVTITMSLKGRNRFYGSSDSTIITSTSVFMGTRIPHLDVTEVFDIIPEGEELFIEYHISDGDLAEAAFPLLGGIRVFVNGSLDYIPLPSIYSKSKTDDLGFGPVWRGWGRFVYNGNDPRTNEPIDEDELIFDPDDYDTDIDDIENPNDLDNNAFDPASEIMIFMAADPEHNRWIGADDLTYLQCDTMSSSRFGEDDLATITLGAEGGGLSAPVKKTLSTGESFSAGVAAGPVSGGLSQSSGTSVNLIEVMDMNLDGYPDLVKGTNIQYTLPTGGLAGGLENFSYVGTHFSTSTSSGITAGGGLSTAMFSNDVSSGGPMSVTIGRQGTIQTKEAEKKAAQSISLSGGVNDSNDQVEQTWMDINGDGLQDLVTADGQVRLNIGYDFLPPMDWNFSGIRGGETSSENAGGGVSLHNGSISFGVSVNSSTNKAMYAFQDVNGDGLIDKLIYNESTNTIRMSQNTGTSFLPATNWVIGESLDRGNSIGESVNAAFTVCINFFFFRICVNPQASAGRGLSRQQTQFSDINGDGFPDFLKSVGGDGNLEVRLSKIGKTNMLKTVHRPLNSTITLDYDRVGNTYELPSSIWVLSSTEIFDGLTGDGVDTMRYRYEYEGGFRDRHERQFYGFSKVKTLELDTENDNSVYRTRETVYANDTYYRKGLKLSETTLDADTNIYARSVYDYELRDVINGSPILAGDSYDEDDGLAFPAKIAETTYFHEGAADAQLARRITYDYDVFGNVTHYRDSGDDSLTSDWVEAEISYHNTGDTYIFSPSEITVAIAGNASIRKREADIDDAGNVTQIRRFLSTDEVAVHGLEYDQYGNLTKITSPTNESGQAMFYRYEYDEEVHTYTTKITDAFGYESSSTYDYRFGQPLSSVDINGQEIRYTLDEKGRMSTVTGPYEIAAGIPFTIAMTYYPDAVVPYAVTQHYEPDHPGDFIETYTFIDGMQRPVQIKKTGALFAGDGVEDQVEMIVSGRSKFDAFGRTVESYYPVREALGTQSVFNPSFDSEDPTQKQYDILDREVKVILPDAATTEKQYGIAPNNLGKTCLFTSTIDPLGNKREAYADVRERQCADVLYGDDVIWTSFTYNPINELQFVINNSGDTTAYVYDPLGRKLSMQHPDAGLTTYEYDLAGNQVRKQTPNIRERFGAEAFIRYDYEYQRPISIAYPRHYQNNVRFHYGEPGAAHNRAGRLWLQEDASGGQEFFFGRLGEQTKVIRTVVVNQATVLTYISETEYDTWNRIKKMKYPDGEEVTYHYNRAGKLRQLEGTHLEGEYDYVRQLGYDKFEQRVFLAYGNGTSTEYTYESTRRRLNKVISQGAQGNFMDLTYTYDAVDNITVLDNAAELTGSGELGGKFTHNYEYDQLYRLTHADGTWTRSGSASAYELDMAYDDLHNITEKDQVIIQNGIEQGDRSYENTYHYDSPRPHVTTQIGGNEHSYDSNGNLTSVSSALGLPAAVDRQLVWDEENRLQGVIDNTNLSQYTYDAKGERVVKSYGRTQALFFNGTEAGFVNHNSNYTVYVSPYLVAREEGFSKHYFIEGQRIASRLGEGRFNNNGVNASEGITAGQLDYQRRAELIGQVASAFYDSIYSAPGHVVDPDRPIAALDTIFIDPANYATNYGVWGSLLPDGSPEPGEAPGHPVWDSEDLVRDSLGAGYGWVAPDINPTDFLYFYHPDHLGSTGWVTDIDGRVSQHLVYIPFGATFVEEYSFSTAEAAQAYLFNGKELDRKTGLYYYGARYYDPQSSIWLSVDPMMEKYPGWSPYNYTLHNPVRLVDPDGKEPMTAVIEGVVAFGLEAGFDFIGNMASGMDASTALKNVDWRSAAIEGTKTAIMSTALPPGAGTVGKIVNLARSKGGQAAIGFTTGMANGYINDKSFGANLKENLISTAVGTIGGKSSSSKNFKKATNNIDGFLQGAGKFSRAGRNQMLHNSQGFVKHMSKGVMGAMLDKTLSDFLEVSVDAHGKKGGLWE